MATIFLFFLISYLLLKIIYSDQITKILGHQKFSCSYFFFKDYQRYALAIYYNEKTETFST